MTPTPEVTKVIYKDALNIGGVINNALLGGVKDLWLKTPFAHWPVIVWYSLIGFVILLIFWWFLKNFIL